MDNQGGITTAVALVNSGLYPVDSATVTQGGLLELGPGAVLDISAGGDLNGDGTIDSRIVLGGGQIAFPASYTLTGVTLSQKGTTVTNLATNLTVGSGGIITHEANATTLEHMVNLTIGGDLTVQTGGLVTALGRGYLKGNGPGTGTANGGAAHGGQGGDGLWSNNGRGETTYGSVLDPATMGSGGSGGNVLATGGGVIRIQVSGGLSVDGDITADGGEGGRAGSQFAGGGAGGSVAIAAETVSGSGSISANGGTAKDNLGGGGGGGRVAVRLSTGANVGGVSLSASGSKGKFYGAAGTVYLETATDGTGAGTVTIDNAGFATPSLSHLPPAAGSSDVLDDVSLSVGGNVNLAMTGDEEVAAATLAGGAALNLAGSTLTLLSFTDANGPTQTTPGTYTDNTTGSFDAVTFSGGSVVIPQTFICIECTDLTTAIEDAVCGATDFTSHDALIAYIDQQIQLQLDANGGNVCPPATLASCRTELLQGLGLLP